MSTVFSGGCLCGAIRYESTAEPVMAGHCQCADCRRLTGTGHASFIFVPKGAFTLSREPVYHERRADSGNTVRRGFCGACGSPVIGDNSGWPDVYAVPAGSLDDPDVFKPRFVVYTSSRQPWDSVDPDLTAFPKMPPQRSR